MNIWIVLTLYPPVFLSPQQVSAFLIFAKL